jgi:arginase
MYINADTNLSTLKTSTNRTFAGINIYYLLRTPSVLDNMKLYLRPSTKEEGKLIRLYDASNCVLFSTNIALEGNTREHFAYLFKYYF